MPDFRRLFFIAKLLTCGCLKFKSRHPRKAKRSTKYQCHAESDSEETAQLLPQHQTRLMARSTTKELFTSMWLGPPRADVSRPRRQTGKICRQRTFYLDVGHSLGRYSESGRNDKKSNRNHNCLERPRYVRRANQTPSNTQRTIQATGMHVEQSKKTKHHALRFQRLKLPSIYAERIEHQTSRAEIRTTQTEILSSSLRDKRTRSAVSDMQVTEAFMP
ncbi:hypothetical protein B0J13DRAFT_602410 [Dactylonectria estremocensis]|uniref:Uncharacterized protein n=1 Tax=Dactylonectria estremocensis TaxID=1079267 RepID=A0A9P9FE36_9HYPO|nr:hypothetical protein B0J13DRAFT_602410 [Dactylonectria estremocensis]